jgi:hypothetical protein
MEDVGIGMSGGGDGCRAVERRGAYPADGVVPIQVRYLTGMSSNTVLPIGYRRQSL